MRKLIAMFLSVLICLNIFSGMAFAAPVAESDSEPVFEKTEFNGTEDLIQKTIQKLIDEGKVVTELEKPDAKLVSSVEACSGMNFDAVKTAVANALKENKDSGKIDMSRYNLNKSDAAELLNWVLRENFLVEAVTDIRFVTNASGVAVEIRYTMSSGMSAALDGMQDEIEYFEDNYDIGAVEDAVSDEIIVDGVDKKDYLAALDEQADEGENTEGAETPEQPTCMFHTVPYVEVDGQPYAAVQATWEMSQEIVAVDMTKENPELAFDPTTGEVGVVMVDATTPGKINLVFTCTSAVFQCAKCGEVVERTPADTMLTNVGEQTIYFIMATGETVAIPAGTPAEALPDVIKNGTENVDWVNYTNMAIAVFPDDNTVLTDPALAQQTMVTLMYDAGQARVEHYYSQMSLFNALNADVFGVSSPYWTSKNTKDNPMAAVKVLCNMDANMQVPPNQMLLMVQMLPQAFMSYVMEYKTQLLMMKDFAMAELKRLPANATDVQKMLVLHDWLAEHASFDMGSMTNVTGTGGNNDPIQMTTFGAVLSEQLDGYYGGICLAYAAAYNWLIQWAFPEYYQKDGKFLPADKAQHITDFVQIKFFANTSETSVAGAGFGGGYFNNVHYFNAVKAPAQTTANAKDWFYVDVCYDDISVECISQYRVEADGNLSHMNFLTSPKTIESLYKSSTDYIDSLYDGYDYVLTNEPYRDDDGNIVNNSDGSPHYKYEMVANPNEKAYDNACYEDSWFSGAISPIHFDGTNWYYVDSGNTYVAYKDYMDENGDFNIGNMGNMGGNMNLGDIMHDNRVDPANGDKLKVRAISAPDYFPNTNNNNGGMGGMNQNTAKTDPYAEVLIKYGYGHVATNIPQVIKKANDRTADAVFANQSEGDANNNHAGMTGMILEECQKDFAMNELYPGLVHTIALNDNVIYFNLANAIYTLDLTTGNVDQLKEYNDVYVASEVGHNFKGASFYSVAADSEDAVFHVKNRPIASFAIRNDITFTPIYVNYGGNYVVSGYNTTKTPTLICAIATNYAHSYPLKDGSNSEFDSYTKEASNYNPDYQRGISDEDSNDNCEFLWCANIREKMPLKEMLEDYKTLKNAAGVADGSDVISVTVGEWCEEGSFTDIRTAKFGLSDGSSKEIIGDAKGHHFEMNEDRVNVCRHCLALAANNQNTDNANCLTTVFKWDEEAETPVCTSVTVSCYFDGCTAKDGHREYTGSDITNTVGENTVSASVTLANGSKLTDYRSMKPGDVNGDDKINVIDAALLSQYIKNPDNSNIIDKLADFNADGKIDEVDVSTLRSALALVSSTTSSGVDSATLSLAAKPTSIRVDSEGKASVDVEISIAMQGNNWNRRGVSIMDLSLTYDSALLTLKGVSEGSLMRVTNNTANALLLETEDLTKSLTANGVLATLTFEINGTFEADTKLDIGVKADSAAAYRNGAFESVAVKGGNTSVNVLPYCPHEVTTLINAVAATCTENGYTGDEECNNCKEIVKTGTVITAAGHNYILTKEQVDPTCTTAGHTEVKTCTVCKHVDNGTEIEATGHTEEIIDAVAPTCTTTGLTEGKKCTVCEVATVEQQVVDALGHNIVIVDAVAPTCTETGLTEGRYCTRCDAATVKQEVIPALGHDMIDDIAVAATCTTTGLTAGEHCSRCDAATVKQEVIAALGHDMVAYEAVPATCTQTGHTEGTHCSRCEEKTGLDEISALGHYMVNLDAVPATCTKAGLTEGRHCLRCDDATVAQKEVPALGHNMIIDAAVAATCTTTGLTEGTHCSRCDAVTVKQEVVAALGHDIVKVEGVLPTCTSSGLTEGSHCSRCTDMNVAQQVVAALGHDIVIDEAVAPTCTNTGLTEGQHCLHCDAETVAQQEVAALGHNIIKLDAVAPTCTETGLTAGEYCSRCDDATVMQQVVEALGHDIVKDEAVAATCTETGLTEGQHCSRCYDATVARQEVEALGHDIVKDEAVTATCTTAGLTAGEHCSRCDEATVKQEVVDALGHNIIIVAGVAATCTEKGLTDGKYCSRCDAETVEQQEIAALGHDMVIDKAVAATCTTTGLTEGKHCSRCDAATVAQKTVDALGHKFGEWSQVKAPTITEEGLEIRTCATCGEKQSRSISKLDYLVGDADNNGQINAADARLILRVSAKIDKIESLKVPFAVLDMNKDNQITAADARIALRIAAKLEG